MHVFHRNSALTYYNGYDGNEKSRVASCPGHPVGMEYVKSLCNLWSALQFCSLVTTEEASSSDGQQFFLSDLALAHGAHGGYGEGNGSPLQYSCLENPMDGGAWWAAVHGVAKSRTQLSDFTFTFHFPTLEKEMATDSIPGMAEPGGLPSMGSHRVEHDWSDLAAWWL